MICTLLILSSLSALAGDARVEALIEAGHWKRARPLVESRHQANPNDPEGTYLLSRVKMAFGDLEGALPLAERAVALDGAKANYHYQLAAVCGAMAERASIFKKAGLAKRFKDEAEKAVALDPKNVEALFALMEFYRQAPRLMGGDKKKAHEIVEQIIEADPPRGYLDGAILAQEENDTSGARAFYSKALVAGPRDYDVLVAAANFYRDLEPSFSLAEQYARAAIKVDPGRAAAYSSLAALYAKQQRRDDLDTLLAQAEKAVPDDLSPCYAAARTLLDQARDLPRAERYFRKYLTQEPEAEQPSLAHAHWQLGLVLEKEGRKPEALSELQAASKMDPRLRGVARDLDRVRAAD